MDSYFELFDKFYNGTSSPEENDALLTLLESGENGAFEDYCRTKWNVSASYISNELKAKMKSAVLKQIPSEKKWFKRTFLKRFTYSAVVTIILFIAVQLGWHIAHQRTPDVIEVVTEAGQKTNVTLPDGSKVWLNSASKIEYTSHYNIKDRSIILDGEAYFDVAPDKEFPFIVRTDKISVTALGTKFNVRAYKSDDTITTTLLEGKVKAEVSGQSTVLKPNQLAVYDKTQNVMNTSIVKDELHPVPWMQNGLLFENESLADIAVTLERMYNVRVVFADECVKDYSYTGFIKNNSLPNVLELISGTSPVKHTMTTDTITLYKD